MHTEEYFDTIGNSITVNSLVEFNHKELVIFGLIKEIEENYFIIVPFGARKNNITANDLKKTYKVKRNSKTLYLLKFNKDLQEKILKTIL